MSEPANELEKPMEMPEATPLGSPQGAWLIKEAPAETPTAETTEPAAETPAPPADATRTEPSPPPPGLEYLMPLVQQQARTNATLEQLAQMTAANMAASMPRPEEPPPPDPIDQPEAYHKYMFDKQFAPLKQQIFESGLMKRRMEMAAQYPDYPQVEPLVQQMSKAVPQEELLKPGTMELLYMAARGYMGMPQTQAYIQDEKTPAKPGAAAPQRWPAQSKPSPGVPAGTPAGPGKSVRMSEKFIQECRRMGNKPEEVIEFIKKEGGNPEDYM